MELNDLRIALGLPINAITAEPAFAEVADAHFNLQSPCLVIGENGQGKSLLAKALSKASVFYGTVRRLCRYIKIW
ncbi:MAG: sigma-54 factor interaction domain-containing protein [Desulfobacteraceae bacterium]|nr:sigma-54 factor interaction domain-containing protein [Desulfobacteraceae bacterium]